MSQIHSTHEWVLGPQDTPFFTKTWSPTGEAKAHVLFVHGFAEHVDRYDSYFKLLASSPYNLRIFAFDQRGSGRTSFRPDHTPMPASRPIPDDLRETERELIAKVEEWRKEGKKVDFNPKSSTWRASGGWARVMPDMEWFVGRESEVAKEAGKKFFLYGHSMGGGQCLGFVTRQIASAPSASTVALLSGVIVSGPLIRQGTPANRLQVAAGGLAAKLTPNMLIAAPVDPNALSHDAAANKRVEIDPLCENKGSLRGLSDMLTLGMALDDKKVWDKWPKNLPLCLYVGEEDSICDPKAGQRFGEGVPGSTVKAFKGAYHEVHLELPPTPEELAKFVGEWVEAHAGTTATNAPAPQPGSKL